MNGTDRSHPAFIVREGRGLLAASVAADPDIAFVVDVDTVIRRWPIVTLAWPSPVSDEIARLIELKDWWRRCAAFRRFGIPSRVLFLGFEGTCAMYDPHVIFSIHRDADHGAYDPVIRQWFRPEWVDFESWGLNGSGFNRGALADEWNAYENGGTYCAGEVFALHAFFLDRLGYDTRFGSV